MNKAHKLFEMNLFSFRENAISIRFNALIEKKVFVQALERVNTPPYNSTQKD
jgi:hypothetical protein